MNGKIISLIVFVLAWSSQLVPAAPAPVTGYLVTPVEVGSTRLSILFWDIYDITLYTETGKYDPERPFALAIRYLRDLDGELIAEKSVAEMRRQGISEVKLADWFVQMKEIFPDVTRDTELIGIFRPGKATRFYEGRVFIGEVPDPDFGIPFSRIWLGEETRVPKVREELLGLIE